MNETRTDHAATRSAPAHASSGRIWPFLIVGLIVGQGLICAALVTLATNDSSFVVESHYYEKALAWDATEADRAAQEALGWRVEVDVGPLAGPLRSREVAVSLADQDGRPLEGAAVEIEAFHQSHPNDRVKASLTARPGSPGRYAAAAAIRRAGVWEVKITIRRGPDVYAPVRHVDVAAPPEGDHS